MASTTVTISNVTGVQLRHLAFLPPGETPGLSASAIAYSDAVSIDSRDAFVTKIDHVAGEILRLQFYALSGSNYHRHVIEVKLPEPGNHVIVWVGKETFPTMAFARSIRVAERVRFTLPSPGDEFLLVSHTEISSELIERRALSALKPNIIEKK